MKTLNWTTQAMAAGEAAPRKGASRAKLPAWRLDRQYTLRDPFQVWWRPGARYAVFGHHPHEGEDTASDVGDWRVVYASDGESYGDGHSYESLEAAKAAAEAAEDVRAQPVHRQSQPSPESRGWKGPPGATGGQ